MTQSRNWVGWSNTSGSLNITLPVKVSPTATTLSGDGILAINASVDALVYLKSYDMTGSPKASPSDLYFLHVYDSCA